MEKLIDVDFAFNTLTYSLNVAMPSVGAAIVAPLAGVISDKYGRKRAMIASSVLCIMGMALQSGSTNGLNFLSIRTDFSVVVLVFGRFTIGLGIGIGNIACSTYIAETSIAALLSV